MEESQEQSNSRPWLWKKGQSGNPGGRKKGSKSMKTWVKEMLETMDDDKRQEFLEGISKEVIWKMGEGAPQTNTDVTTQGEKINESTSELITKSKLFDAWLKEHLKGTGE
jgi:hypothetical protein